MGALNSGQQLTNTNKGYGALKFQQACTIKREVGTLLNLKPTVENDLVFVYRQTTVSVCMWLKMFTTVHAHVSRGTCSYYRK